MSGLSPRLHRRGPIEARLPPICLSTQVNLHAFTGVAQLKRACSLLR